MNDCLDCLTITETPTAPVTLCPTPRLGGYKALFLVYCGVKIAVQTAGQNAIAALLAGTDMALNANAQLIAAANGAAAGTTTANLIEAAQWKLAGDFGVGIRGGLSRQDAITHQGGSCEQPTLANNTWRAMWTFTKVGGGGVNGDRDMMKAFLKNPRAYHLISVECGEDDATASAVVFKAGTYVISEYNYTRPEDGIREFVTRQLAIDFTSLLEPESYAFPIYGDFKAVFQ